MLPLEEELFNLAEVYDGLLGTFYDRPWASYDMSGKVLTVRQDLIARVGEASELLRSVSKILRDTAVLPESTGICGASQVAFRKQNRGFCGAATHVRRRLTDKVADFRYTRTHVVGAGDTAAVIATATARSSGGPLPLASSPVEVGNTPTAARVDDGPALRATPPANDGPAPPASAPAQNGHAHPASTLVDDDPARPAPALAEEPAATTRISEAAGRGQKRRPPAPFLKEPTKKARMARDMAEARAAATARGEVFSHPSHTWPSLEDIDQAAKSAARARRAKTAPKRFRED